MKFADKYREYFGFADEREEAESNRITRRAFYIVIFSMLLLAYYLMQLDQLAYVHDLDPTPYMHLGTVAFVMCLIVAGSCLYVIGAQSRKGIVGGAKFSTVDTFPVDFGIILAVGSGIVLAVALYALRCIAEFSMVGAAGVYWIGNLAISIFYFPLVVILVYVFLYLTFKDAKKRQAQIMAELGIDED